MEFTWFDKIFGWLISGFFGFTAFAGLVAELDRHFGGVWKGILTIVGVIFLILIILP